jgi:hypothetical protein
MNLFYTFMMNILLGLNPGRMFLFPGGLPSAVGGR